MLIKATPSLNFRKPSEMITSTVEPHYYNLKETEIKEHINWETLYECFTIQNYVPYSCGFDPASCKTPTLSPMCK